ncbi:MAG: ABC transporter permease [Eubacterium sp.]|nr:ABC transporter permease [Eubacterium sp.]
MKTLVKTSLKLLLRTKAFWFFLLLMPALSTLILKVKFDSSAAYTENNKEEVVELATADTKVAYYGGKGEYVIKVYDASGTDFSDYLLEKLSKNGMFLVCKADLSEEAANGIVNDGYIQRFIDKDGYEDRMGSAIYIHPDFDEKLLEGNVADAVTIYTLSEDGRNEALENEISFQLSKMEGVSLSAESQDKASVMTMIKSADDNLPEKEIISVAGSNGRQLSIKQTNQKSQMGYAFAFMTLCFVFCGIFVAHTSIKEQKNGVLTRITLTKSSTLQYFASKFITVVVISLMITAVMAVYSIVLSPADLGMSRLKFIIMIFLMGLIFNSASMLIGIIMGDVMGANVAAFTMWCLTALLSGLYFPLNYTTTALKALSHMMPQKWFLEGTEMIFVGDNKAFPMLICITAAYLIVILSLGSLGLKIRRTDSWGNS